VTRDQVIERLCVLVGKVYHAHGDYTLPSDGFCPTCQKEQGVFWGFQHAGETLDYVEAAVNEKLKADGHSC
jgi:hypothetical protein